MCSVESTLTDPGPLCPGDTTMLICNGTDAIVQTWSYRSEQVVRVSTIGGTQITPQPPLPIQGVAFSISVLSTTPQLVTQLSFVADTFMDAGSVSCNSVSSSISIPQVITLQVANTG